MTPLLRSGAITMFVADSEAFTSGYGSGSGSGSGYGDGYGYGYVEAV